MLEGQRADAPVLKSTPTGCHVLLVADGLVLKESYDAVGDFPPSQHIVVSPSTRILLAIKNLIQSITHFHMVPISSLVHLFVALNCC
jgi:hypothetical protein